MGKKGTGPGRRKSTMGTHPRKDEYLDTPTAATSSKASSKGGRWNVGKQQRKAKGKRFGKDEEQRFEQQVAELGARISIMASDGNCLFRALADQLRGRPKDHGEIRQLIVDFMEAQEDDFAPFVEDDEKWVDYVPRMRNEGEWGGQQEICAASRCFRVNVVIHQLDSPRLEISFKATAQTVHLSFHGAAHYNSIRAMDDPCREGEPAKAFMALTATPSAASTSSSTSSSASSSSSSSSPLRPKKSKNQRLQEEASREASEPQDGEEDGNAEGVDGLEGGGGGDGQGNTDGSEGNGNAEEGTEAGTTAKVGGQCPCGSGKKWRKCCRKAERQRERFRSGGLGKDQQQQQGQGQGQRPPQQQQRDDEDDREGAGVLTQKLAAIAL